MPGLKWIRKIRIWQAVPLEAAWEAFRRSSEHTRLIEKGPGRVGPLFVPMMISNMAAGNVSIHFGLKGKSINVVTACATGTNTIGEAFRAIQYGEADIMVSGGTGGKHLSDRNRWFYVTTALTAETDPERCSIPFDKERSGFVMGEGAAVVVEELEYANAVAQKIYAEVVGYGCSSDAYHITSPAEDGSGAARAMLNAVQDAGSQWMRSITSMHMEHPHTITILRRVRSNLHLGRMPVK